MPAREPPGVEIKGSDEYGDESFEFRGSKSRHYSHLFHGLDELSTTPQDIVDVLPLWCAPFYPLQRIRCFRRLTTPTGECARNDRRISRKMLSNTVPIEGATATECVWKESSDIKSSRRGERKLKPSTAYRLCPSSSSSA